MATSSIMRHNTKNLVNDKIYTYKMFLITNMIALNDILYFIILSGVPINYCSNTRMSYTKVL